MVKSIGGQNISATQVYGLLLLVHTTPAYMILFVVFSLSNQFTFSTFFSFAANSFGYVTTRKP